MTRAAIEFDPLTPAIGAEVRGLDLRRPLDDATFATLKRAWSEHLVLFFRDQRLSVERLQALGRALGPLHVHPLGDLAGHPGITEIRSDADSTTYAGHLWHSDATCELEPPIASVLYLHEVPATGGDTLFANMYAAYDALSAPIRALLDGLSALHSGRASYGGYFGMTPEQMRDGRYPEAIHPVVVTHPVTGGRALYVNENFTVRIEGLAPEESRALLEFLFRHLAQARFQCRFRWRPHSVALWDNRCTQHLAIWDYHPHSRAGYRATALGGRWTGACDPLDRAAG